MGRVDARQRSLPLVDLLWNREIRGDGGLADSPTRPERVDPSRARELLFRPWLPRGKSLPLTVFLNVPHGARRESLIRMPVEAVRCDGRRSFLSFASNDPHLIS